MLVFTIEELALAIRTVVEHKDAEFSQDDAAAMVLAYLRSGNRAMRSDRIMAMGLDIEVGMRIMLARQTSSDQCSDCHADGDKDCICGGAGTREEQIRGLKGAVAWWREKYEQQK